MIEQHCSLTQISLTVMTRLLKNSGVPVSSPAAHRKGFNQEEIVKFLVVEEKKLKKIINYDHNSGSDIIIVTSVQLWVEMTSIRKDGLDMVLLGKNAVVQYSSHVHVSDHQANSNISQR